MFSGSCLFRIVLFRCCVAGLLIVAPMYVNAANDYATLYSQVLNNAGNSSGIACMDCHTANSASVGGTDYNGLCGAQRNFANYNDFVLIPTGTTLSPGYIGDGTGSSYMPLNPADCSSPTTNELSLADVNKFLNWDAAGRPQGAPTANTDNIETSITKTSAVVQGDFNTNVFSGTTVSGTYYFQYGTTTSYGGTTSVSTLSSLTTLNNTTKSITGLACGKLYHYRAVATNGAYTGVNAGFGSDATFSTSNCTSPTLSQQVAGTYTTNEDTATDMVLLVTDPDPGTLTWSIFSNGSKGVASITGGTTTLTPVTGGTKTIHYVPNLNQNGSDSVTILVTSNKGNNKTASITLNISITPVNDPPVVSASGTVNYTEGDPATTVDSGLTVSDVDGDQIMGATVTITNYASADGEVLACTGTLGSGNLTGITGCGFSAGTLTLTGTTSTTNYQNALRTVTYYNPSANPTVSDRTVQFVVQDNSGAGNNTSVGSNVTVSVSAVSTPPTITGFSGTTAFTEQTPVIVDSSVVITDPDSPVGNELNRAQMILTTNYNAAQDSLVCPSSGLPSGITCGYAAPTLTLSSASSNSLADYQTAIALVKFNNTSDNPTTGSRTVTLTARDTSNTISSIVSKTISITRVNDPPSITSSAPTAVITEQTTTYSYQITQTDVDDTSFTYSLGGTGLAGDTPAGDMKISASGLITWTPPRTGIFNKVSPAVTVTVTDADSSTGGTNKLSDSQIFTVTTSPPDNDAGGGDGVPDYSDNCPSVANASQADMDNDTVHILPQADPSGIPANGDVDPTAKDANGFLTGGDACDEDIDGDGMPNTYENLYPFLNPLDPTDAAKDYDGDGVNNLAEYRAGTPPDIDSVPPVVIAPAAVTVNSTGYLTDVDLGFASAFDGNDGSISSIVPIIDATISLCSELSSYPLTAPPFRPGLHAANWSTCDKAGNVSYATQDVRVRPILSATPGLTVGAGQTATVKFMLNGPAADYPVSVHYQVGGSANSSDYNLSSGLLTINQTDVDGNNPGLVGKLSLSIANPIAQDENITISLSNATNAVLGAVSTTQIAIVNHDTTPVLTTDFTQNGVATGRTVYADAGPVVLTVTTSDSNSATTPVFDWSMTDNAISGIGTITNATGSSSMSFNPLGLAAGIYHVVVTVNDGGQTNTTTFSLNVEATAPDLADCNLDGIADSNTDCDGDGIANTTEGAVDSNGNGIPDYLDDNRIVNRNVLQNETGDPANTYLLATDPGLQLRLGTTALASGASGVLVSQKNIDDHGGPNGGIGANSQDSDSNDGGFYDFEVTGLNDMITSARVVIPLQSAILDNAVYRKYNGSAWSSFVVDANNTISSAPGNNGVCPAPGSIEYTPGLIPLNTCVELLIEDGGPNDADGVRDFVIRDPGGVAVPPAEATPAPDKTRGGTGVLSPALLLLVLAVFSLLAPRRKVRSQTYKAK